MKLDSSLNQYNRLIDKSLSLNERLKLAESLWNLSDSSHVQANKQQLIVDWLIDLLINKRRYAFTDTDLHSILVRFNHFLANAKFSTPINGGLPFVQVLFEAFASNNSSLKQTAHDCCYKLFRTKFSHYLTRNIDQMTKFLVFFVDDLNETLDSKNKQESNIDERLTRVHLVLQKYFLCLKSQQNQNRLFNRLCGQILFSLLNLIENLRVQAGASEGHDQMQILAWKILKYSFFSKSHSNIYSDFYKNLPASFSSKSNYQVTSLFSTIKSEGGKTCINLQALCKQAYTITREIFNIASCEDYKTKMQIVQFMADLIWSLNNPEEIGDSEDLVIEAIGNLIQIVQDLSLFNKVDDMGNQNMFKSWSKSLLTQTFSCKFSSHYTKFLTNLLHIDHVILDTDLSLVLKNLKAENNLNQFLEVFLDQNVKFRQLSRATHLLLDVLKKNKALNLPEEFHARFSECLENYNVDAQTLVHLWKDLNQLLSECSEPNLQCEYLRFLSSVLSRVNLTNQKLPSHLKAEALQQLDETKQIVYGYLNSQVELKDQNRELVYYLDCLYTTGLVYLMLYRYSITSTSHLTTSTSHTNACLSDLNQFLTELNSTFNLSTKTSTKLTTSNTKTMFYLNRLQLLNIFVSNLKLEDEHNASICVKHLINMFNSNYKQQDTDLTCEPFNIQREIKSVDEYLSLHLKYLLVDNFHLITPIIRRDSNLLRLYFNAVFRMVLLDKSQDLNAINLDAMFNDKSLVKDLLVSFLGLLTEYSDTVSSDAWKGKKFLEKLEEFVLQDGNQDILFTLFESKKPTKASLNAKQASLVFALASHLPLDFLDTKHGLVLFFLCEKISTADPQKITIYVRLFSSITLLEAMPLPAVQHWLMNLLKYFEATEQPAGFSNSIFDKLVKKCIRKLLIDDTFECLTSFVQHLLTKLAEPTENPVYLSFAHLALIQVLENISKIQEFSRLALNKVEDSATKLNKIFNQILGYFIQLTDQLKSEEEPTEYLREFQESHLFYICLILMRRVCNASGEEDSEQLSYFQALLQTCMKVHKKILKAVKAVEVSMEVDGESDTTKAKKIKINSFHIDFVRSCIHYTDKLTLKDDGLKIKPLKLCKSLVDLLFSVNESFEFDVSFFHKLSLNNKFDANNNTDNDGESSTSSFQGLKFIIIKSLALSLNSLSVEENSEVYTYLEEQASTEANTEGLVSLVEFVSYATCDMELVEALRTPFSEFTQKLLIQLQPTYISLSNKNCLDTIIRLLKFQTRIGASKYFIFPSHLIISTIQIFVSLDYNEFSMGEYIELQELACKTLNIILTRYSRKFSKISAIVCNLLTKLVNKTTSLSDQTNLTEESLPLAVKAAQDLERIITRLASFKKDYCKIAPYMISEYACTANTIPIHPAVKSILSSAVYNLISICDIYGVAQLHVALPVGARELFKTLYVEYEKYFKYTGKT